MTAARAVIVAHGVEGSPLRMSLDGEQWSDPQHLEARLPRRRPGPSHSAQMTSSWPSTIRQCYRKRVGDENVSSCTIEVPLDHTCRSRERCHGRGRGCRRRSNRLAEPIRDAADGEASWRWTGRVPTRGGAYDCHGRLRRRRFLARRSPTVPRPRGWGEVRLPRSTARRRLASVVAPSMPATKAAWLAATSARPRSATGRGPHRGDGEVLRPGRGDAGRPGQGASRPPFLGRCPTGPAPPTPTEPRTRPPARHRPRRVTCGAASRDWFLDGVLDPSRATS